MKLSPQHPQDQNQSQNCYSFNDALPFKLKSLYLLIYFRKETINPKNNENTFLFKRNFNTKLFFMKMHKNETTSVVFGCRVSVKRDGQGPQANDLKSSAVKGFFLSLCKIWYYKC